MQEDRTRTANCASCELPSAVRKLLFCSPCGIASSVHLPEATPALSIILSIILSIQRSRHTVHGPWPGNGGIRARTWLVGTALPRARCVRTGWPLAQRGARFQDIGRVKLSSVRCSCETSRRAMTRKDRVFFPYTDSLNNSRVVPSLDFPYTVSESPKIAYSSHTLIR